MRTVENAGAGKHLQQPLCVCGWASIMVFGQTEGQSSDMNTFEILCQNIWNLIFAALAYSQGLVSSHK